MVTQTVLNLDDYFHSTQGKKIIVNSLDISSSSTRDELIKNIQVVQNSSSSISLVPSCDCGKFKLKYLEGEICPYCETEVVDTFHKRDPILWLQALNDENKFLSPFFWYELSNAIEKKVDVLRWISDSQYNPPNTPLYLKGMEVSLKGFERSYKYLINNLEEIINYLISCSALSTKKYKILENLELYKKNKHKMYSTYLPLVNKNLFVMEKTSKGAFTNFTVSDVIDLTVYFADTIHNKVLTEKVVSSLTGRTLSLLGDINHKLVEQFLITKKGTFRKHVYGTRSHFTLRAVISLISGPHDYNELHVPFSGGVTLFRPHLLNLLMNRHGKTYNESTRILRSAVNVFDPLVYECLNTLIEEAPFKGIPTTLLRNPSLLIGSIQLMYITKFKMDISDKTLGIPIHVASTMNGDFDGDKHLENILKIIR